MHGFGGEVLRWSVVFSFLALFLLLTAFLYWKGWKCCQAQLRAPGKVQEALGFKALEKWLGCCPQRAQPFPRAQNGWSLGSWRSWREGEAGSPGPALSLPCTPLTLAPVACFLSSFLPSKVCAVQQGSQQATCGQ